MTDNHCKYEKEIGKYFELVAQHEKYFKDNGSPGLISTVNEVKHQVVNLVKLVEERDCLDDEHKKELEGIRTAMSGLVKAYEDMERWRKEKEEQEEKKAREKKEKADYQLRKSNLIVYIIVSLSVVANAILSHIL